MSVDFGSKHDLVHESAGIAATGVLTVEDRRGRVRLARIAPGQTIAQVLFLEGLWPTRPFCSGLGRCGHCLVYVASGSDLSGPPQPCRAPSADERASLSIEVLERGGRLACRRTAEDGLLVRTPFAFPEPAAAGEQIAPKRPVHGAVVLAVDLGTTSLHWQMSDETGVLAQGRALNPQLAAGSEVMSRLGFALAADANARKLRDVVLRCLHDLIVSLQVAVDRICVAGNTVMTALLLNWPLHGLAAAPYRRPHPGGGWTKLPIYAATPRDSADRGGVRTYIPPQPAPFIGGDLSAGLTGLQFGCGEPPAFPFLLADLGTNGEFILALGPERYLAASVPLGPALEGIGMSCGSAALPGVWVDVAVTPQGLRPTPLPYPETEGKTLGRPESQRQRISGTGYLALLAGLLRLGLLDPAGGFTEGEHPLARRIGGGLVDHHGERRLQLGPEVALTGRDVEEVLKVKAAFNLAFSRLLEEGGLGPGELRAIYLAGALGEHVDLAALEELGFVPPGSRGRIRPVGNTSLAGAAVLVTSSLARDWIEKVASKIKTVDIGQEPDFFSHFTQRLVFHHV